MSELDPLVLSVARTLSWQSVSERLLAFGCKVWLIVLTLQGVGLRPAKGHAAVVAALTLPRCAASRHALPKCLLQLCRP